MLVVVSAGVGVGADVQHAVGVVEVYEKMGFGLKNLREGPLGAPSANRATYASSNLSNSLRLLTLAGYSGFGARECLVV